MKLWANFECAVEGYEKVCTCRALNRALLNEGLSVVKVIVNVKVELFCVRIWFLFFPRIDSGLWSRDGQSSDL